MKSKRFGKAIKYWLIRGILWMEDVGERFGEALDEVREELKNAREEK